MELYKRGNLMIREEMGHMKERMEEMSEEEKECGSVHGWMPDLTEEQKKKIMRMKSDIKILFLEKKIKDMENAIEMKKKMIDLIKKLQVEF